MPTLTKYRKMRDFAQTSEPSGVPEKARVGAKARPGNSYVIQKHAARRLHYDFRLEVDGVLLSWAVPKGPSLDPEVKRLAVETEPHPLEYGSFEGTIPKGQYGGGTVMVWDRGTFTAEGDARKDYERGRLSFTLQGDKLRGAWHLVRTGRSTEEGKSWLLFKSKDEFARPGENTIVEEAPDSAVSGRSIEEIAAGASGKTGAKSKAGAKSKTNVKSKPQRASRANEKPRAAARASGKPTPVAGTKPGKLERVAEPELATLVTEPPAGDGWIHELKFDGYRVLARLERGKVTLLTRNGKDWTDRMGTLARAFAKLDVESALIDGELVALNERGVSDFQALQNSLSLERDAPLVYYAFDLLHLNGLDVRGAALTDRKVLLQELMDGRPEAVSETIRLSEHVVGRGAEFFEQAGKLGLEGIVSKRANAPYRAGRGHDWVKVKCSLRQEFLVVGYSDPGGSRSHLGALLLGTRKGDELVYSGRVGTGFTEQSLRELYGKLKPLERKAPSVTNAPRGAEVRDVHWVEPELVAEVAFTGFTEDGRLRHPTFQGLREDKAAKEVRLEKPDEKALPAASAPVSYPLTNPNKVMYPELGITKRELLDYYALVAERMLPHVQNRPLTIVRCPNGRDKPCFFQKHPGKGTSEDLRSVSIREREGKAPYSVLDDAAGLFALVQLGSLEIHTWGSRADDFEHPDLLVFDLDPDPALDFQAVIDCAQRLRAIFESAKLESFVKTAGGKGLHVCIPVEPDLDWEQAKAFSGRIAEALTAEAPDRYLATPSKARRKGKIFIDYLRNARGATFIAPYSTRARENAPIAAPLEWDELTPRLKPDQFTLRNLKQRLERLKTDPFERMAKIKQRLRTDRV